MKLAVWHAESDNRHGNGRHRLRHRGLSAQAEKAGSISLGGVFISLNKPFGLTSGKLIKRCAIGREVEKVIIGIIIGVLVCGGRRGGIVGKLMAAKAGKWQFYGVVWRIQCSMAS